MDNDEARFLLSACQPTGSDSSRPEIGEALAQARRDPELADWLKRERRSDAAISRKLCELEPTPDLRARLLAGGRATRRARNWRSWRVGLGLAAAISCVAGFGWWGRSLIFSRPAETVATASLEAWQLHAVGVFSNPLFRLDRTGETYAPLAAHLVTHQARVAGELPFTDAIVSAVGCKVLKWQGATISLTCFRSDTGELVHLFVGARGAFDDASLRHGPRRGQVGGFSTVTWLRGDLVVMVASKLPAEQLERTLKAEQLAMIETVTAPRA
jgi:hypothetical protein